MLQAALQAKTEYNNIRAIACKTSGFGGGQAFSTQVHASQAEKTIARYSDDTASSKSGNNSKPPLRCYGCDGPHPWSILENRINVIKCPNANNPGIHENAKKVIKRIQSKQKKKHQDFTKRKNLATVDFSNLDAESQERIRNQCLTTPSDATSVTSSVTGMTVATTVASAAKSPSKKCVVFLYDALALTTETHRPVLPVSIQSIMPHINLQLGTDINNTDSPSIRCVVDTATALCTGNYHFFLAIAKQYPQCVAKIFLSEDYSPIILLGIVQDNADAITTDLPVAFQFHLPYFTKDGSATFFVVATGPQVSMNTVLSLPLITATGMIIDFVDEVVEAKNLDCPPFKIDFRRATKTVPAPTNKAPTTHYIEFEDVQQILQRTDAFIAGVCKRIQSGPSPPVHSSSVTAPARVSFLKCPSPSVSNADSATTSKSSTTHSFEQRWIPPPSAHDTTSKYHDQVLGENGYL
jgi:hypothetical protein